MGKQKTENRCKNCEFGECINGAIYCEEYDTELSREDFDCEKFLKRGGEDDE